MIRRAVPSDASAIAAIHVRAWQAAYEGMLSPDFLAALSVEQRSGFWHRELTANRSSILASEEAGAIVGWASGGPSRESDLVDASEVYAVYVLPANWRRGIGKQLMLAMEESFPLFGDRTLWVLAQNRRAIDFYRTLGYQFDGGEKSIQLGGVTLSEIRLRKNRPNK